MKRVLIIAEVREASATVARMLSESGVEVRLAPGLMEGLGSEVDWEPDLILFEMKPGTVRYPGFTLNRERFTVHLGTTAVDLTQIEMELLWRLATNPGRTLPRDLLLEQVWGFEAGSGRTLEVHLSRIRTKLGAAGSWIRTVRGVGYRFELPLDRQTASGDPA